VPWQLTTGAVTVPSHVAPAMHIPLHWTLSSPGSQATVTSGGMQLTAPVQFAVHIASTFASTVHWPPEIAS
jgi:hypothetical protein